MEKSFDKMNWIRDLVKLEEQMEETGIVDMTSSLDDEKILLRETALFLSLLKNEFIEAANVFNQLKSSPLGRIKVYGIAKTEADFMLFRNGFKMIFSLKSAGSIAIRFNFFGPNYIPNQLPSVSSSAPQLMDEHSIEARKGAFGELIWTYQEQPVNIAAVVKYHITLFIRESTK